MSHDISKIRANFPVLHRKVYDKPLIYLDSAASTQKPVQVLMCEEKLHNDYYGNIHRGAHFMADKATEDFENVRTQVRDFINAKHREEIIFTKGTTESVNLVAFSFCENLSKKVTKSLFPKWNTTRILFPGNWLQNEREQKWLNFLFLIQVNFKPKNFLPSSAKKQN